MSHKRVIPKLSDYHICEDIGFLLKDPLEYLPEYFESWNYVGHRVDEFLEKKELRKYVEKMPLLDHSKLCGHRELRLAYMYLSFIGNGYVWQDGEDCLPNMIPKQLAIPWCGISSFLGLNPGVSTACGSLSNWRIINENRSLGLRNMRSICSFPGGASSSWFFLLTAQVELDALPGIKAILEAMKGAELNDIVHVISSLNQITDAVHEMKATVSQLHDLVDPDIFYNQLRPLLTGWGGEGSRVPEGIIYEGVSDKPIRVIGESAAQTASMQCFDAALGIKHEPHRKKYLDVMRTYMLPAHSAFIEAIENGPSVREFVSRRADMALTTSFERSVSALREFRSYHLQIVTKYVIQRANKKEANMDNKSLMGTGGTEIIPFLKSIRDTTVVKRETPTA